MGSPHAHALLSPSGASRWLVCTPSARLEQTFPDRSGEAAAEGTLAHSLAELCIEMKTRRITKAKYKHALAAITEHPLYSSAMFDYIDAYADYVVEQFQAALAITSDAMLFLETRLDMTDYVPESFGTGDVCIVADHTLDFIDLKFGKGVPVSATENRQMMLYALGALKEFGHLYDINTVRMTIHQPRLDSISVWSLDVQELVQWAENELRPRAKLAFDGKGDFSPGKACTFCRAKAVCKANAEYHLSLAKLEFAHCDTLTDDEVSDILTKAETFSGWITAVKDHALRQAVENGKVWPGYKLVEGRSVRKYSDEIAVVAALRSRNIEDDQIFTKKIMGITALQKEIGKIVFADVVEPLLVKPQGAPTLVVESDKRPVYENLNSAQNDFADEFIDY